MPDTTEGQHLLRQVKHLVWATLVLILIVGVIVLALQVQVDSRNRDIQRVKQATEQIDEISDIVEEFKEAADQAEASGNQEATRVAIRQIAENSERLEEIQAQLALLLAQLSN